MSSAPDDKTDVTPQPPAAAADPAAPVSAPGGWQGFRADLRRRAVTCKKFAKELMHEHEFWVHALAVKGGASAIVITAVLALSYVVAAPFLLAAAGIAACGAVVGLGIYGIAAGSMRSWYRLRKIYHSATGKPLPPKPADTGPDWLQRQYERPRVKQFMQTKAVKAFVESRLWTFSKKITLGQQDNVLGGLAVGGAVLSLALGAAALTTQILVLPVVAMGGLVVGGAVMATSYLVSGVSGLYFGIIGIRHMREKKREKAAARAAQEHISLRAAQENISLRAAQNNTNNDDGGGPDPAAAPAPEGAESMPQAKEDFVGASEKKTGIAAPAAAQNDNEQTAKPRKNISGPKA